jgi:uncharacterized membrane protein YhfC
MHEITRVWGAIMSLTLIFAAVAGTVIAILPAFLIFLYIARFKGSLWVSALLGGLFWFVAYLARTPILVAIDFGALFIPVELILAYTAFAIFLASLMAGLFEEGTKYGFLRWQPQFIQTLKHALCFGLGWGISEALWIYAAEVLTVAFFYEWLLTIITLPPEPVLITSLLFGAIERNLVMVFATSATIFVALAVWHQQWKYALLAITAHFLYNFIPIMILQFILAPILPYLLLLIMGETMFALFTIFFALLAYYLLKREGGPSELEPEPPPETEPT